MRRALALAALAVCGVLRVPAQAQQQHEVVYVPGSTPRATLVLDRTVELGFPYFVPRLRGGDGAAGAVVIERGGTRLWSATMYNAPGALSAVVVAQGDLNLAPGRYTVTGVGALPPRLTFPAPGLPRDAVATGRSPQPNGNVRVLTAGTGPGAHTWLDPLQVGQGELLALGGDNGPGSTSTGSLCVGDAVPTTCDQPDALGSNNVLIGPYVPPLPVLFLEHEHALFALYRNPKTGARGFRGDAGAGTTAWHAAVQTVWPR